MNLSACLVLLSSIFHLTSASRPWMGTLIHNQQDPATTTTTTDTAIAPPPTATYLYINTTTPQTLCNISETGARRRSRHPHRRDAHRPKSGPSSPPPPPPPPAAAAPQNKDGGEFDGDEHEVVESRSGSNTSPLADCAALAATYASHDGYWDVTASGPGRSGWQYFARGSCSFGLSPEFSAGGRSGALWVGNRDVAVMIDDLMQSNQNGPPWTPVLQISGQMACTQHGDPAIPRGLNWTVYIDGSA